MIMWICEYHSEVYNLYLEMTIDAKETIHASTDFMLLYNDPQAGL